MVKKNTRFPVHWSSILKSKDARIFLCYAREDQLLVEAVYNTLKKIGLSPWMDKKDLLPGQLWQTETPRAIKKASFVMIFFSKHSIAKRGYVQREFKLALDTLQEMPFGKLYIIPVRLDDCEVPDNFQHLHYCDMFDKDGFELVLKTIRSQFDESTKDAGFIISSEDYEILLKELEIARHRELIQESDRRIKQQESEETIENKTHHKLFEGNIIRLRSEPGMFSWEEIAEMLKEKDFFDKRLNKSGKGIIHDYKLLKGGQVVHDAVTGLFWQQGGSGMFRNPESAYHYIDNLNLKHFAGYKNWRLPTFEEAMSLMEPNRQGWRIPMVSFYISQVFDTEQRWIWTADRHRGQGRRVVLYDRGFIGQFSLPKGFVRAVRSDE